MGDRYYGCFEQQCKRGGIVNLLFALVSNNHFLDYHSRAQNYEGQVEGE